MGGEDVSRDSVAPLPARVSKSSRSVHNFPPYHVVVSELARDHQDDASSRIQYRNASCIRIARYCLGKQRYAGSPCSLAIKLACYGPRIWLCWVVHMSIDLMVMSCLLDPV